MTFIPFLSWLIVMMIGLITPTICVASGVDVSNIALGFITTLRPLWIPVAVVAITIAGFVMVISRDEGSMDKARSQVIAVIIGSVTITLLLAIGPTNVISFVFNGTGNNDLALAPGFIELQAFGIAEWVLSLIAVIGVLMVIIALLEAVTSLGDEGAYTKVRTSILNVTIGLIVIVAARIIRNTFYLQREPSLIINYILSKILIAFNIILVIAVALIVYAGVRMVASFGNEDDFNNAKALVFRIVIGILLLLVSYSFVQIVLSVFS